MRQIAQQLLFFGIVRLDKKADDGQNDGYNVGNETRNIEDEYFVDNPQSKIQYHIEFDSGFFLCKIRSYSVNYIGGDNY